MTHPTLGQMFDLTGRVAIVTGGSRGLGAQIAEALAEFGARLVLVARKEAELAARVSELETRQYEVIGIAADLADPEAPKRIVDAACDQFGGVDILVNNAGATWGATAEDYPLSGWQKVIDVNLTGPFLLSQEVGRRAMIPARYGRIINIASVEGMQAHHPAMSGTIAYNTSKAGLVNFTRALAAEWGGYGITVNAIAPGYFPSKMTSTTLALHEETLLANTPLGKLGGEGDLKGPALLFASNAGGHITGQVLVVDGGAIII